MSKMEFDDVKSRVEHALYSLCTQDSELFNNDVNERTITTMLARYLAAEFPDYDVDCEYNRHGENPNNPKTISVFETINKGLKTGFVNSIRDIVNKDVDSDTPLQDELINELTTKTVFPDIIVHKRSGNDDGDNLLIIEAKKAKAKRRENMNWDEVKLEEYTKDSGVLKYIFGLLLTLPSKIDKQKSDCGFELVWYEKGGVRTITP